MKCKYEPRTRRRGFVPVKSIREGEIFNISVKTPDIRYIRINDDIYGSPLGEKPWLCTKDWFKYVSETLKVWII